MKKGAYGLYGASRMWYLEVDEKLMSCGMKRLSGDLAVFTYHVEGKLKGIVEIHVDDFLTMGDLDFVRDVVKPILSMFKFSKIELNKFRFCGLELEKTQSGIRLSQDNYLDTLKCLEVDTSRDWREICLLLSLEIFVKLWES